MAKARAPQAPAIRFKLEPAYASPEKTARRMGLTPAQFATCCPRLYARGFPVPDETTGMYHIEAVDRWCRRQRPDLFPELTVANMEPIKTPPRKSMGERFAEAQERRRNG